MDADNEVLKHPSRAAKKKKLFFSARPGQFLNQGPGQTDRP
jgi:hypothetical protein